MGKCCSFKDAKWRVLTEDENTSQPTSTEIFFGECDSVFHAAKLDEINKWKLFETFI